jgi:hypothetical protein
LNHFYGFFKHHCSLGFIKEHRQQNILHAVLVGLFWGVLNGITQSAFFDQYLTNNSNLQERFKQSTFIQPRYLVLVTGGHRADYRSCFGGMALLFKRSGKHIAL